MALAAGASLLSLAGCGGGGESGPTAPPAISAAATTIAPAPVTPVAVVPVAVWFQDAMLAPQAKAAGIGIMLGVGGEDASGDTWPETFGGDNGELEAIKAAGMKAVGGIATPWTENTSPQSVASMMALDAKLGGGTLIGYNAGDEPQCGGVGAQGSENEPAVVAAIKSFDPTRLVFENHTAWVTAPLYVHCLTNQIAALQSADVASSDFYPVTNPYLVYTTEPVSERSDFNTVGNDTLWVQGLMVSGLAHYALARQSVWAFVESGGDNFGGSLKGNPLIGSITSNVATNLSNWSKFTPAWIGLSINGRAITAITDAQHAVIAAGADVAKGNLTVTGGIRNSDCVGNICVVNGNEYRATPAQVNAEVWSSIINGAVGIEYFCHDSTNYGFCLVDPSASASLTATNADLQKFAAPILTAPIGICTMQTEDYTKQVLSVAASCSDGVLTLTSLGSPAMALVKSQGGATYVFAQSDRRGAAAITVTLNGSGGKTATVSYDSNARFDAAHSAVGSTFKLGASGQFSDTLGANGDDYETRIYTVR